MKYEVLNWHRTSNNEKFLWWQR